MTSAKDLREIKRTKDLLSKAKRLHVTKKKIEAKVREIKGSGWPKLEFPEYKQPSNNTHRPLLELSPIPRTDKKSLAFDNCYLSICLFGAGIFLGLILKSL